MRLRWSALRTRVANVSTPVPAIAVLDAVGRHMTFHNPALPTGLPTLTELAESLRLDKASAELLLEKAISEGDVTLADAFSKPYASESRTRSHKVAGSLNLSGVRQRQSLDSHALGSIVYACTAKAAREVRL